jgi:glutathione synthase/RimK-type ligase-like ATP-grasp enzyme/gamma-glutamyl:cysteine ligase YbdK (ATP-grasp superfamily)
VVTADEYLAGGDSVAERGTMVVNLCRSYRYRSKGYYVSLLADARGQTVVPSVETVGGMADAYGCFRALNEAGVSTLDTEEADKREPDAEVLAIFGSSPDPRFRNLAHAVYRAWPAPVLRLSLVREEDEWQLGALCAVPPHQLEAPDKQRLIEALGDARRVHRRGSAPAREEKRASIAVLFEDGDPFNPSTPETLDRLERVAARMNVYVNRIGLEELDRLAEYDALWIRVNTTVSAPAFQFALRAEALGMPVVDDSQSIIRCSNKVFLEELLRREGVPTPRTQVLNARTPWKQVQQLGSPVVLKLPDGSFSAGVHKIGSEAEYRKRAGEMFRKSPLLIAQEFLPTEYDWRVTVLDGKLLFAARYFMARGHWQIRSANNGVERYGRVEAVQRERAPREIVELALRATAPIGRGLYGVDIKPAPGGPVVIEINDNPNLDIGYEDAADGNVIYEDLVEFFLRRVEDAEGAEPAPAEPADEQPLLAKLRSPVPRVRGRRSANPRAFSVAGMELEYPVVDRDLNVVSRVEDAFRILAGRPVSDVDLGAVGFSNEIADHVFEIKTSEPVQSLATAEDVLVEGVRRFGALVRSEWDARLLPTGMHPWMDPRRGKLWTRSNLRIYTTYARLFDVRTHGWMNVHAAHLNLPFGTEEQAVAMHTAAALLIPYLPALAASSPMYDGDLQESADGRLHWILQHQAQIPESCGAIVPEYVGSFAEYRKCIFAPMYAALDRRPNSGAIRHEFFNARGAVLRFARRALEIRVLDTQECVRMDIAIAVFVRSVLRVLSRRVSAGKLTLPGHSVLVADFHETIRLGSHAEVQSPHLGGPGSVREVLRALLADARRVVRPDEALYLDLVERIIETGTLAEHIRAAMGPYLEADDDTYTEAARRIYIELAECLEANEPWQRRRL